MLISINWLILVTSWFGAQKIYSKMHLILCTNTHCDVTDLVNHGMVKNTKTWISWERNIIFLRNKKINLCFRWHILRSYRFVVEVTFNNSNLKLAVGQWNSSEKGRSNSRIHLTKRKENVTGSCMGTLLLSGWIIDWSWYI